MSALEHPGPYRGTRNDFQKLSQYWAACARYAEAELERRHKDAACNDPLCSYRAEVGPLRERLDREMGKLAELETARHNTNLYWAKREKELEAELGECVKLGRLERARAEDAEAEVEKLRRHIAEMAGPQMPGPTRASLIADLRKAEAERDGLRFRLGDDCPDAEVCKSCPCAADDDVCFPGERLRAERDRLAEALREIDGLLPDDWLTGLSAQVRRIARAALEGKAE